MLGACLTVLVQNCTSDATCIGSAIRFQLINSSYIWIRIPFFVVHIETVTLVVGAEGLAPSDSMVSLPQVACTWVWGMHYGVLGPQMAHHLQIHMVANPLYVRCFIYPSLYDWSLPRCHWIAWLFPL